MTLILESGWPQCGRDLCTTDLVPGTDHVRPELRQGDVETVLTAWAAWFHRNVRSIEPADGHRNWWGWSATNTVWNSNHLGGVALDLCSDELPWKTYTMPADQVDKVHAGLQLFEGNVYWGRDWGDGDQDEMHFQCGYNTYLNPNFAAFAQKLRDGYLGIFGPPDPDAFPLPAGYYWGPLTGPEQSISGDYASDLQAWKDGLGRWQQTLGLPVTKHWDDGQTPQAATTLQQAKGWPPNPAIGGFGGVYQGEWDAVIREGWRLPQGWTPQGVPPPAATFVKWVDVSQYQSSYITDAYPHRVVCFRASIADPSATNSVRYGGVDQKFVENMKRARTMLANGQLDAIMAYHFWVPGFDNVGTFRNALDQSGGDFPELIAMLDVEDGGSHWNISGDQSAGCNDWVANVAGYLGHPQAVCRYQNFRANPGLWLNPPPGLKTIVPAYDGDPIRLPYYAPGTTFFAKQYSDSEDTAPFGPVDVNQANVTPAAFLAAFGISPGRVTPPVVVPPVQAPPVVNAGTDDTSLMDLITAQFEA